MERVKASNIAARIGTIYGLDIATILLIVDIIIKLYQLYQFCNVEPGLTHRKRVIKTVVWLKLGRKLFNKHGSDIVNELSKYTVADLKNVDPN